MQTDWDGLDKYWKIFAAMLAGLGGLIYWTGVPAVIAPYGAMISASGLVAIALAGIALIVQFLHYYEIIGGNSVEYSKLLKSAENDSCSRWLGAILCKVDAFFGDVGAPGQRALLLLKPAALWTAGSFDRCLLLALHYPIVAMLFILAVSGDTGPAESAVGLAEVSGFNRLVWVLFMLAMLFSVVQLHWRERRRDWLWLIPVSVFGGIAPLLINTSATSPLLFVINIICLSLFVNFAGYANYVYVLIYALDFASFGTGAGVVIGALVGRYFYRFDTHLNSRNKIIILYIVLILVLFLASRYLALRVSWDTGGVILLYFGLLTLVNAPFDWLSLGFTRLLLRCGMERGGLWPYLLAAIDIVVGAALIMLLAMVMVAAVDLFNYLAELGGGEKARVLPPMRFYLAALRAEPQATEFWWVYSVLCVTMVPRILILFLAGFVCICGLPRNRFLSALDENEVMPVASRVKMALLLSFKEVFALTTLALTGYILWYLMPMLSLGVLDLAEKVAM
jgi:hypothetical protein